MAAALSLSLSLDPHILHFQKLTHFNSTKGYPYLASKPPLFSLRQFDSPNFRSCVSPYSADSASTDSASPPTYSSSEYDDPFQLGNFVTNEGIEKRKALESFVYFQELESGTMWVRLMRPEDEESTINLLAASFSETMALGLEIFVRLYVEGYVIQRKEQMPHAVTLLAFFKEKGSEIGDHVFAGTVEVTLDERGANVSPPTPIPPKSSPYICNMTVSKPLRRRGIGWHLLKAGEELITRMTSSEEVYLHCRTIDAAPFNMYMKAGYEVVSTDGIFNLMRILKMQPRKHLMCKKNLPVFSSSKEFDTSVSSSSEEAVPSVSSSSEESVTSVSSSPEESDTLESNEELFVKG